MPADPTFFREGETEFGVFYPRGYLLAVFADPAAADRACPPLRAAGFGPDDVRVTPGADAVARYRAFQDARGVGDRVRQFFAHLYGDESAMLDDLIARAERGEVLVLAYAPDDAATARAAAAVRPLGPELLRKYDRFTATDVGWGDGARG